MYRYNFPERKRQRQIVALKHLRLPSDVLKWTKDQKQEYDVLTKAVGMGSQMGVHSKRNHSSRASFRNQT